MYGLRSSYSSFPSSYSPYPSYGGAAYGGISSIPMASSAIPSTKSPAKQSSAAASSTSASQWMNNGNVIAGSNWSRKSYSSYPPNMLSSKPPLSRPQTQPAAAQPSKFQTQVKPQNASRPSTTTSSSQQILSKQPEGQQQRPVSPSAAAFSNSNKFSTYLSGSQSCRGTLNSNYVPSRPSTTTTSTTTSTTASATYRGSSTTSSSSNTTIAATTTPSSTSTTTSAASMASTVKSKDYSRSSPAFRADIPKSSQSFRGDINRNNTTIGITNSTTLSNKNYTSKSLSSSSLIKDSHHHHHSSNSNSNSNSTSSSNRKSGSTLNTPRSTSSSTTTNTTTTTNNNNNNNNTFSHPSMLGFSGNPAVSMFQYTSGLIISEADRFCFDPIDASEVAADNRLLQIHKECLEELSGIAVITGDNKMNLEMMDAALKYRDYTNIIRRLYAWATPTERALRKIAEYSPNGVLEVGAGTGYWARLLRERGVDVLAYDDTPLSGELTNGAHHLKLNITMMDERIEYDDNPPPFTKIASGSEEMVQFFTERSLLLCYPPPEYIEIPGMTMATSNLMGVRCLEYYDGNTVIYVGEWKGQTISSNQVGTTAGIMFQKHLLTNFDLVERIPLPNWPFAKDDMTIWSRKQQQQQQQERSSKSVTAPGNSREKQELRSHAASSMDGWEDANVLRNKIIHLSKLIWEDFFVDKIIAPRLWKGRLTHYERKILKHWGLHLSRDRLPTEESRQQAMQQWERENNN